MGFYENLETPNHPSTNVSKHESISVLIRSPIIILSVCFVVIFLFFFTCCFQALCRWWTKRVASWRKAARRSPTPLWRRPCAARRARPCWQGSTFTTTTRTPTTRTAPLRHGRLSTSLAPSLSTSTTRATGQVWVSPSYCTLFKLQYNVLYSIAWRSWF